MKDDKDWSLKTYNLTLGFDWIKWGGDGVGIYAEEEYDSTGHMMNNPFIEKMGEYQGEEIQKDFNICDAKDIDTLREKVEHDLHNYKMRWQDKITYGSSQEELIKMKVVDEIIDIIRKRFGYEER